VEILKLLSEASTSSLEIPEVLRKNRRDYIIFQERAKPRAVRNFEINHATANLLEYFGEPRSLREFLREFNGFPAARRASEMAFWTLLERGVLKSAKMPSANRGRLQDSSHVKRSLSAVSASGSTDAR